MKKYEMQHLITICKNFPKIMSGIIVKNDEYKKEILNMVVDCDCNLVDDEIRFKNGSVIQLIKHKGENIKGKTSEITMYIGELDYVEYEDLKDIYNVKDNKIIKEKKMCRVIETK